MGYQYSNSWYPQPYYPAFGGANPGINNPFGYFNGDPYANRFAPGNNYFSGFNNYFGGYNIGCPGGYNNFLGGGNNTYFGGYNHGHSGNNDPGNNNTPEHTVKTDLIEVGYYTDGKADKHAQSVMAIYKKNDPQGQNNVQYVGIGNEDPDQTDNAGGSTPMNSKQDLDAYIDGESSDALNIMSDRINNIVKTKDAQVINGSLGYSRDNIYENVLLELKNNPNLATNMGLQASDITSLKTNEQGQVLVTPKVSDAIVHYVDQRMDRQGSAYQKSLSKYQKATKNAANHGVTVVVAAGNEHELNDVFSAHTLGGDTNFLAQSDNVISVAATDDNGTSSPNDDQMASFSSRGDGRYNPTVSAKGVGVSTPFGKQDGTSFAAPQVAALVARMEQDNPNLTFAQIKAILQQSATDIDPSSTLADGAGVVNPNLALQWSKQMLQTA